KCVLLKDSWWVLLDDVTPEGEIYSRLHRHSVPNIPLCSCASNVGDDTHHKSRTHKFIVKSKPRPSLHITSHRHYRLVLDDIGRKLQSFTRSWEMINVVHTSLVGTLTHPAYKAGVLHRDISVGNIMIIDNENEREDLRGGMLIDWDLSKLVDPNKSCTPHQYTCTGTWQFMAAALIKEANIAHTFVHDLESAFWVVLWMALSFM
ncbi:hypothetical protein EI94DRAFT_1439202, partial [Lactarius quietus]